MSNIEINAVTKICKQCGEEKLVTEFYKQKLAKDGLQSNCKKCDCERSKIWHQKNKEHKSIIGKTWSDNNKEHKAVYNRIRYQENREHMVAVRKAWRDANPEKNKLYRDAWRKANPEKSALHCRNRNARNKEAIGTHTATDVQNLFTLQKGKCAICNVSIKNGYHVDHIIAIVNGGSNDKYNLQLLCTHCNCTKRSKDPIVFMNENGKLI